MLKPIDLLVGLKILCHHGRWTQMEIANKLLISASQVNNAIKELLQAELLVYQNKQAVPVYAAFEEFLIAGVKYCFAVNMGELTVGIPTAYAATPLNQEILVGNDPIPVWPDAEGTHRGLTLEPLHPNVPKALRQYPNVALHDLLTLVDAMRIGRAREKALAKKMIALNIQKQAVNIGKIKLRKQDE